jgi:hypothetical protein
VPIGAPRFPAIQNADLKAHGKARGDPRCAGPAASFAGAVDRHRGGDE